MFWFLHSRCVNQLFPRQHLLSAWQEVLFLAGWIFLISLPAFCILTFCFVLISAPSPIPLSMVLLLVLPGLSHPFLSFKHPHHPLLLHLSRYPVRPLSPASWNPAPGTSPHTPWFCTHIPLCMGHSVGTPCPWLLLDWSLALLSLRVNHHSFLCMMTQI